MLKRLVDFVVLQLSAAIFGIGILSMIMVSSWLWQDDWPIYRYDFLFIVVLVNTSVVAGYGPGELGRGPRHLCFSHCRRHYGDF